MTLIRWIDTGNVLDDGEDEIIQPLGTPMGSAGCIDAVDDSILVSQILDRLTELTLAGSCSVKAHVMFLMSQINGTKQVAQLFDVTQRWVQMSNQATIEMIRKDMFDD